MQYLANLATSALLGLLVAVLAAVAASRTPALAGTPLAALAAGRGTTGRATRKAAAGRPRRNGTGRDADKPTGRGTGRSGTGRSGTGRNGTGRNGNRAAGAARGRAATKAESRVNAKSGIPRLGMGALRQQVLDYLQQHVGEDLSPTQVANALGGRSSGAVGNALETLTKQGQVTKTSDAPRRFTIPAKGRNGRARKADSTPAAPTAARSGKRQPGRAAKATTGRTSPTANKAPAKATGTGRNGNGARKGRRTTR